MKIIYTGLESSGKDLHLSIKAEEIRKRNIRWLKKRRKKGLEPNPRTMAFSAPMSKDFIAQIENNGLKYMRFQNLEEVMHLDQVDIFMGELLKFFPASNTSLPQDVLDFLTQGAKSGVHLFGASQDFSQVHKQFRRLVNNVYVITKIIGSRRPIKSAPPVNKIWGLCMIRSVIPSSFKGDNATMESNDILPSFTFIKKEDCVRFDTTYKVSLSTLPPKIVRKQDVMRYDEDGNRVLIKTQYV